MRQEAENNEPVHSGAKSQEHTANLYSSSKLYMLLGNTLNKFATSSPSYLLWSYVRIDLH
jgi:hypothetical protein